MYEFELRERADEDAGAASYEALYHDFPIPQYWDDDFAQFVRLHCSDGDRLLDLGCGPGSLWPRWQSLRPSRLVGVDLSERMIAEARTRHGEGEFVVGRAHELPFEDGSFDVVIASAVLHHIPDSYLDSALKEISRVLDEHGRLVGRDAASGGFGGSPGWLSGALMSFRHLAFRLTRSREFPEPTLGEHHHPVDPATFAAAIEAVMPVRQVELRFPFSSYLLRVRDSRVASMARLLDERLAHRNGSMLYFAAEKNFVDAQRVREVIKYAKDDLGVTDAEFLAYLQAATDQLEKLFSPSKG